MVAEPNEIFEAIPPQDVERTRQLIGYHIETGEKYISAAAPD